MAEVDGVGVKGHAQNIGRHALDELQRIDARSLYGRKNMQYDSAGGVLVKRSEGPLLEALIR